MFGRLKNLLSRLLVEIESRQYPLSKKTANGFAIFWAVMAVFPLFLFWEDRLIQVFGIAGCAIGSAYWYKRGKNVRE